MSRKVIVVHNESEVFTKSNCDCHFCLQMHASVAEWDTFVPETNLQKRMIETVSKIENRAQKSLPIRRSPRLNGIVGRIGNITLSSLA